MTREDNVNIFNETLKIIMNDEDLNKATSKAIFESRFYPADQELFRLRRIYDEPLDLYVSRLSSFDAARRYKGKKVAVLNFASATTPGGGVTHGSFAQEEALCRTSTLYNILNTKEMWELFYLPHRLNHSPLNNDDIIYSPGVVVIRSDDNNLLSKEDYFTLDVITCAAPNLNQDSNEFYISNEELYKIHYQRGKKILDAAYLNGVEVLILGAFGCGAFRNDPHVVASAYNDLIKEYKHNFDIIEFAVFCPGEDTKNYDAFKKVIVS